MVAGIAVAAGLLLNVAAASADEITFVKSLADKAIDILRDRSVSLEGREDRLRSLLHDSFAMEKIGRFVVGRYWNAMTPDQQGEYQELFAAWVLRTYSARLGGYSGQQFVIDRTADAGSSDLYVRTRIVQDGMEPLRCDWRIRDFGGTYKVVDVVVEGVSMLATQLSEFGAVLRKHGPEGLIEALQARLTNFPATS
jgi:phospholipid transport system substrate-binding protein